MVQGYSTQIISTTTSGDMKRSQSVDEYIETAERWQDELVVLRKILRSTELSEEVKWGAPCYTFQNSNVVSIGAFKSYFGLWFHQGALLKDKRGVLINAQEGTTRALRQWRMNSATDIRAGAIKSYVVEAIQLVKAGSKIAPRKSKPLLVPPELQGALARNSSARKSFDAMRPGLRREYADYVAAAKRDETKQRRIDKIMPMIAAGKGLNDKYR